MKTIYKYSLEITDFQEVDMPEDAEILCVQAQPAPYGAPLKEQLTMWAMVDTENAIATRRFRIFGTGNPVEHEHSIKYIGTVQMHNHKLTWHVYENYIKEYK
jgi:hypothetical protein